MNASLTILLAILFTPAPGTVGQSASEIVLGGKVTVRDRAGEPHAHGSGKLWVEVSSLDGEYEEGWHPFRDGRWEMTVSADALVSIGYAESGPDPMFVVEPSDWELPVPASRSLDVQISAQQRALLRVYDAGTGEDLDGVTVLRCWGDSCNWGSDHPVPGASPSEDVVVQDAASPVLLPHVDDLTGVGWTYWVRAPGYAWRRIRCEPTTGGVLSVPLAKEAQLCWEIEGDSRGDSRVFWMHGRRATEEAWSHVSWGVSARFSPWNMDRSGGGNRIRLDACLPGTYELSLRSGDAVASARCELSAGRTTLVESEWRNIGERIHVEGTLTIPGFWSPTRRLELTATGPDRPWPPTSPVTWTEEGPDPTGKRTVSWSSDFALPGPAKLMVGLENWPEAIWIDLEVSASAPLHHDVPAPATLVVRCTDEESGEPLTVPGGAKARPLDHAPMRLSTQPFRRDRRTAERSFHLPPGPASLRVHKPGWIPAERTVEVGPGTTAVHLELRRAHALELRVLDGEQPLVAYSTREILDGLTLTRDGSPAEPAGWSLSRGIHLDLDHPGPWTVELPPLPGFEPVEPFEVLLERGEKVERVLQLERVRP